jgi:hypothetical protein
MELFRSFDFISRSGRCFLEILITKQSGSLSVSPAGLGGYSRRKLMKLAAAGGFSLAAMGLLKSSPVLGASSPTSSGPSGGPTDGAVQFASVPGNSIDEKVLNFALTLEILEADLYRQALNLATGLPLDYKLDTNPDLYKIKVGGGGLSTAATAAGYLYLAEFAYVESAHREFLITFMQSAGYTPVTANPGGYKFGSTPEANIKSILTAILPLEETGVRAYLGALPYLTNLDIAVAAGGIYSTEARHSAAISYLIGIDPGPAKRTGDNTVVPNPPAANTFEYYLHPLQVLEDVKPLFA